MDGHAFRTSQAAREKQSTQLPRAENYLFYGTVVEDYLDSLVGVK